MTIKSPARILALLISLVVLGNNTSMAEETAFQRDLKEVAAHLFRQLPSYEKADTYMKEFQENRGKLIKEQGWAPLLQDDEKFKELYDNCKTECKAIMAMMAIMAERKPQVFGEYVTQEASAIRDKKDGNRLLNALIINGAETMIEEQKRNRELAWETFLLFLGAGSQGATAAPQASAPTPAVAPTPAPVAPAGNTVAAALPAAAPPPAPPDTGRSKYAKFAKPMDPGRARQVADSFTQPVKDRKYYGYEDKGAGMVGIRYGGKEKVPPAAPAAGGQNSLTQELASGLANPDGSPNAELLNKAADAICAQRGFNNHELVTQIRICSEEVVGELHPPEAKK